MKLAYTNENRFIVNNIKNLLENANIDVTLKNEFIAGAAGDLSPFDTWLEIWVEDSFYIKAQDIIKTIDDANNSSDWFCKKCHEENSASFEICWKCQHERDITD